MAQDGLVENSNSLYFTLVTFTWGTSSVARYINDSTRFTDSGARVYSALLAFAADLKKQSGGPQDEPIALSMPPVSPFNVIAAGTLHADINVLLEELDVTDQSTRRVLFKGMVSKVTVNKNGRSDLLEVTVAGLRNPLQMPMGIPALNTCAWTFGDKTCGINLAPLRQSLACSLVSGNTITFTASNAPPYWFRGYVSYDGLNIMVRKHLSTTQLELVNNPPASWQGKTLVFTPGCNKSIEDCRRWSNEGNFGGLGVAIPSFHPVYEAT